MYIQTYTQTHLYSLLLGSILIFNAWNLHLDVTQVIKRPMDSKAKLFLFAFRHSHLSIVSSLGPWHHHPLVARWKSQESVRIFPFPSRPAGLTCLLSDRSHLLTFPATPQSTVTHWRPARVAQPALLAAITDPYNPFSTQPEWSSKGINHHLPKTHPQFSTHKDLDIPLSPASLGTRSLPRPPATLEDFQFLRIMALCWEVVHLLFFLLQTLDPFFLCNLK